MTGRILSINVGRREPNPAKDVGVTGIGKRPVAEAEVRPPGPKHGGLGSGLLGDFIGDVQHHGGDRQALYAFAREELDGWQERLGVEIANGTFGENLTTSGLDVDDARVGDRWAVGDEVVLEVTGPRIPCATFAHRMAVPGWLRTFTDRARSGAYLSILTPGTIRTGDTVTEVHRAQDDLPLPVVYRAFMGDLDSAVLVVEAGILPDDETDYLRERIRRRTR
jgi:MOSC domain-containing protein YiiM